MTHTHNNMSLSRKERTALESDALLFANVRCLEALDRALFATPNKSDGYEQKCRDLIRAGDVHMTALNMHSGDVEINAFCAKYGLSAQETKYARLRLNGGVPFCVKKKSGQLEVKEVINLINRVHGFSELLASDEVPRASVLVYVNEFVQSLTTLDVQNIRDYAPKWGEIQLMLRSSSGEWIDIDLVKKIRLLTTDFYDDLNSKVVNKMSFDR